MKKKLWIANLFLVLVLILAGCGAGETSDDAASESTAEESSEESTEESSETEADEAAVEEVPTTTDTEINDIDPEKQVYVTPEWIKDVIEGNEDVGEYVIAEVTWGEAADSPDYLDKHLPGAAHFNTDAIEEGPIWNVKSPEELEQALLDYGVTSDTTLILYGPDTGVDQIGRASCRERV